MALPLHYDPVHADRSTQCCLHLRGSEEGDVSSAIDLTQSLIEEIAKLDGNWIGGVHEDRLYTSIFRAAALANLLLFVQDCPQNGRPVLRRHPRPHRHTSPLHRHYQIHHSQTS
jgi:hypothetical protein